MLSSRTTEGSRRKHAMTHETGARETQKHCEIVAQTNAASHRHSSFTRAVRKRFGAHEVSSENCCHLFWSRHKYAMCARNCSGRDSTLSRNCSANKFSKTSTFEFYVSRSERVWRSRSGLRTFLPLVDLGR